MPRLSQPDGGSTPAPTHWRMALVDPVFGQGGGLEIFPKILPMERSGVGQAKRANNGHCPGPALVPWKLLDFYLSNMHSPTFPGTFSSKINFHL